MQNPVFVFGTVAAQMVNIKKVGVDSELKVSVTLEFMATDQSGKENVFKLIQMQGDVASLTVTPAQGELFDEAGKDTADAKGGNGKKQEEREPVHA